VKKVVSLESLRQDKKNELLAKNFVQACKKSVPECRPSSFDNLLKEEVKKE